MKRERLLKPVDIVGSLYLINVERRELKLKTEDGLRVPVTFTGEQENRVIAALQMREQTNLKVSGLGEFRPDGTLKRVVSVENFRGSRKDREILPDAPTITEMFDAIIAETPPEAWEGVPTDLSHRHDFYIYGVDTTED